MLVIALHRRYQRTCKSCGAHWILKRSQAQFAAKPPGRRLQPGAIQGPYIGGFDVGALNSANIDSSFSAADSFVEGRAEIADQFKACPKCGSDLYTQRPVTKRHPADPDANGRDELTV